MMFNQSIQRVCQQLFSSHREGKPLCPTADPTFLCSQGRIVKLSFCCKLLCGNITSEDFIIQEPPADGHFYNQSGWDKTRERSPNCLSGKLSPKWRPMNFIPKDSPGPVSVLAWSPLLKRTCRSAISAATAERTLEKEKVYSL